MAALLALASSLLWGTGDFLGGRASRSWSVLQVLAWSQLATFTLLWGIVGIGTWRGAFAIHLDAVAIGAAGGVAGVLALAAFYRALAIGPMAVVPPLAASGVILPVVVGLAQGAPPSTLTLVGIAVGVSGVVLASVGGGGGDEHGAAAFATRITPRTFLLCAAAATGFALIFVAMDAAAGSTARSAIVATASVRLGSAVTVLVAVLLTRTVPWQGPTGRDRLAFAGIGMLDTGANLLFALAAAFGRLELVAVLGSLYPAVTSALAHVVLGERLGRVQFVGVALAVLGILAVAGA